MISPATPESHSVVARLHFSKGYTTRHKVCHASLPKAVHHLAPARAAAREAFGREGLSSWHHTMHSLLANGMRRFKNLRSHAGGLVRLVLCVVDWYTSCSSLNLPSAEYAGNAVVARTVATPR